jgi:hypothetical protein
LGPLYIYIVQSNIKNIFLSETLIYYCEKKSDESLMIFVLSKTLYDEREMTRSR